VTRATVPTQAVTKTRLAAIVAKAFIAAPDVAASPQGWTRSSLTLRARLPTKVRNFSSGPDNTHSLRAVG
jgi:hypothetical protein